ncbi:MAG: DUF1592 domain-containing protein [Acidobacteria bacterium]|nr:DUF1592 domain-containing protein [Acidobacteriota bacterium]
MRKRTRFLCLLAGSTTLLAADDAGFRRHVQPFLSRNCTFCHSAKAKVANLDLEKYKSASAVLADQDLWEKIARKVRTGEMPPQGRPKPDPAQIKPLLDWLDTEYARYDKSLKPDPGRVTTRRLNRAEYNNTIRDLTGLDLRPADAFPVDDSGYGFDNIGDVLSISPALMEKYLTAAEGITRAAIAVPRAYKETSDRYRTDRVKPGGPGWVLEVKHAFPIEADYDIRIGLAGRRPPQDEGLQVIALVDGAMQKSFEVYVPENRPRILDFRIRPQAGAHLLKAVLADKENKPLDADKALLVESIEVRGPYNPAPFVPPVSHKAILICGQWPGKYDDACRKRIVAEFARRAFRRPVTPQEVEGFDRYAKLALEDGETPEAALRYSLQAILVSPHFLFRIERDARRGESHPVSEFELATRLSYFLWSSMPDETLFQLARNRQLRKPGILEQQVKRMIADARFAGFVDNFAGQWLELRNLEEVKPAPEKFPQFDDELRRAMKKETQLFFEHVARQDRGIIEFLDARYTFLNERLARHYGIPGVQGPEFRRIELNTSQRGGLLTQASLLTVSSYPTRTSPVIRGKYLLENFLNAPPPPPPPNVPNLETEGVGVTGTLRQQFEKHRSNAVCASCHVRMDALGFGLENYDAIGAWREKDGSLPIDSTGELPGGRKFSSPAELKAILLSEKEDFAQCVTEKMLTYALGRGLEKQDRPVVRQIVRSVAADDFRFSRLVLEIVKSAPFQMRRAEGARPRS